MSTTSTELFPRGMPKRRPARAYIHSTCGCWQCGYCRKILDRRVRRDARIAEWDRLHSRGQM